MARHVYTHINRLWLFLAVLFLKSLPSVASQIFLPGQCRWSPASPETPWERAVCPQIIDDVRSNKDGSWAPWSMKPLCFPHKYEDGQKYCVYTSTEFRNGRGISIVTTPEVAAGVAKAIDDPWFSWERGMQSFDPSFTQEHEDALWEIGDVPGKGKGVIAKRDIQVGEVIMVDYPVVAVSMGAPYDLNEENGFRVLDEATERLPDPQLALDLAAGSGWSHIMEGILKTNNFGVPINSEPHMSLYPKVSRINHDCAPHSTIRYSDRSLAAEVIAYRTIPKGTEISLSYAPLGLPSSKRQSMLSRWGFACTCSLCASAEKRKYSDERRDRMAAILDDLEHSKENFTTVRDMSNELIQLTKMEGMHGKLGEYFETIALAYSRLGAIEIAKRYVMKARQFWLMFDSVDLEKLVGVHRFLEVLLRAGQGDKIRY